MNLEEAHNSLSQICLFNKIFFEDHLGIRWELPDFKILADSNSEALQRSIKHHPEIVTADSEKKNDDTVINGTENWKLLQRVLETIRGSMGYLMDGDLREIFELCDMTDEDKKLAQLDNVFSVSRNILIR